MFVSFLLLVGIIAELIIIFGRQPRSAQVQRTSSSSAEERQPREDVLAGR